MQATRFGWELWLLAFWWATWSLADTYILKYSPWAELVVFGLCLVVLIVSWYRTRRHVQDNAKRQRYSAEILDPGEHSTAGAPV